MNPFEGKGNGETRDGGSDRFEDLHQVESRAGGELIDEASLDEASLDEGESTGEGFTIAGYVVGSLLLVGVVLVTVSKRKSN